MNNKNEELFLNNVATDVSEENIILAPPVELLDEAMEIAQTTCSDEKFPFTLQYNSNQKEFLLSMLETVGAIVEDDNEECYVLATMMNMTQLAFMKQLDCVERVKTDEGINPYLTEEAIKFTPNQQEEQKDEALDDKAHVAVTDVDLETVGLQNESVIKRSVEDDLESMAIVESNQPDNDIDVAYVNTTARSSCCPCPSNINMGAAMTISDESYTRGNICCPGAEQWFKFIATRSAQYTICTTGNLDTVGTLYDCCGNQIIWVDDYTPCGKLNFRIICNLTEGNTYYVKVGVFGDNTGSYTLRVTESVFANYVKLNKSTITLEKGVTYELPITPNYTYKGYNGAQRIPGLSVSINPSNANEQKIWWWEQYSDVLECSYGWDDDNDRYIHVTAKEKGITKLYAQDWNENGKRDECTVYVGGYPVTGISLDQSTKTVSLNDTEQLTATITPANALNKGVTWNSSNWNVVDVDSSGVITSLKVGTAVISATTDEGGYSASCVVSVDRREKVTIIKDSHSFHVRFSDGKVWKNIGIDLSKRQENYGQMYPPTMMYDFYDELIEEEQRYFDNIYMEENGVMEYNTYSVKQIAYLYLLDPLGIEYYMRNHACHDKDIMSGEFLLYKDEVYEAIFGNTERLSGRFFFTIVDDGVQYESSNNPQRMAVYSNAEIIFGSHTIFNWSSFWQSIGKAIFENIPVISHILLGVEMYQALFYSGSIVSSMSGVASEFLDDYAKETSNTILEKMLGWPNTVFNCFTSLVDAWLGAFELNNLKDMNIYAKIQEQDYRTVFDRYGSELTIQEIISKCANT